MSDTAIRDEAYRIAPTKANAAATLARTIQDPWFRSQALAIAAKHTAGRPKRLALIHESLNAASALTEPNRIVTVSAWPLQVLHQFNEDMLVAEQLDRLLKIIANEPHPTRRNDALFSIWRLLLPSPRGAFRGLLEAFRDACAAGHGWKRDRNLQVMAGYLKEYDLEESLRLAKMIEKPRLRRQTFRQLGFVDQEEVI